MHIGGDMLAPHQLYGRKKVINSFHALTEKAKGKRVLSDGCSQELDSISRKKG